MIWALALIIVLASAGISKAADCQKDTTGESYRGKIAVTKSGHTCQRWDSQVPNEHSRTPANYPSAGLKENYCRNPDGESGAWCYNYEGTSPRWELCDIPSCPPGCQNGYSVCENGEDCIRDSYFCDGKLDCPDKSDERNCIECPEGDSLCWNGERCIPDSWFCDGEADCPDESDELCGECPEDYVKCRNGEKCIHENSVCNGVEDCTDGSDEKCD